MSLTDSDCCVIRRAIWRCQTSPAASHPPELRMNRIHRIVFNRATGLRQVVSELARSRGARTPALGAIARSILLLSFALTGATSVWSDGGNGGAGGVLIEAGAPAAIPGIAGAGGSIYLPGGGQGGDASEDHLGIYQAGGGGGGGGAVDLTTGQGTPGGSGG
ncbi:MAG: hypothetical protein EOO24_38840, partial [Comamonadaceae bacterium]